MHAPSVTDYKLLKRILRYVKGTVTMGITFSRNSDFTLCAYSDSDYAGCKIMRRSTSGYCTYLGNKLISWASNNQPTVSKSSTEAEYITMSEVASKIKWISLALRDIEVPLPVTPIFYCDNLSAVYLTANPVFHARTKHFDTDHHYVHERVALGVLEVKYIPAYHQIADIFTKSLPYKAFSELRFKLGIAVPPTQSLRGDVRRNTPIQTESPKQHQINLMGQKESKPT